MINGLLNVSTSKCCYLIIFLSSLFLSACTRDIKQVKEVLAQHEAQKEKAESVNIIYSKDGQTRAKLSAKEFIQRNDLKPAFIEIQNGLKVEFFNEMLEVSSTLTSRFGKYFEENGNIMVRDSVEVKNKKNETLQTQELIWNESLEQFYTDKYVKVITPTQIIYGDGLVANRDFSDFTITNVKGIISVDKNKIPKF